MMHIRSRFPPLQRQIHFLQHLDHQSVMWNSYSPSGPRLSAENSNQNHHHHHFLNPMNHVHANPFDIDPSSVRLRAMVEEFIESGHEDLDSDPRKPGPCTCAQCDHDGGLIQDLDRALQGATSAVDEGLKRRAMQAAREVTQRGKIEAGTEQKLQLMELLRRSGYDAGLCRSETKSKVIGVTIEGHEYVDIELGGQRGRVVVDIGFRAQFQIARPSEAYKTMLAMLPETYVGSLAGLKKILALMCQATKESLHSQGMDVPPWRRLTYMQAKWFSPSSRLTSAEPRPQPPPPPMAAPQRPPSPPQYTWRPSPPLSRPPPRPALGALSVTLMSGQYS